VKLNPNLVYAGTCGQGVLAFEEVLMTTPTPSTPPAPCVGDCNGDGSVAVDEILTMVSIALGNADTSACDAGDAGGDRGITVDEIALRARRGASFVFFSSIKSTVLTA
jgi:hypothetical protein